MKKHEGYQRVYTSSNFSWLKSLIKKHGGYSLFERIYYKISRVSIRNLWLIPDIKKAKFILDIGCGPGEVLFFIKRYINPDANLYGVDLERSSDLPLDISFNFVDVDDKALPFEDKKFDLIISTFVLEHLKNPQNLFLESFRVLINGGYFYCVTENYTSLYLPNKHNFYSDPTHVRPWTKSSLKALAQMCGFEVLKIGHFRPIEYFLLIPFVPILNLFRMRSSFVIYEAIFGKSLYCILKKP